MSKDALTWFEIPVRDMARAQSFYETLLGSPLQRREMGPRTVAVFPHGEDRVGGWLLQGPGVPAPDLDGTVIYLDAGPSLGPVLERAAGLAAKVLLPKQELPDDIGVIAQIVDSEGNRIGLHAQTA